MGRTETTVSPSPPGAGRFLDAIWPGPSNYLVGSSSMTLRNNGTNALGGITQVSGGGGGADTISIVNGAAVYNVNCAAAVGSYHATMLTGLRVIASTSKNTATEGTDDLHCWRVIFIAATGVVPAVTGEVGLYLATNSNNPRIVTDTSSGFGFRFLNDGSVVFTSITGVAPTNTVITPTAVGGYDSTRLHAYELRITGATATVDTQLDVLVDGVTKRALLPATQQSWAAGTILPPLPQANPNPGFLVTVVNMGNVANNVRCNQVRIIAGPTPASLF